MPPMYSIAFRKPIHPNRNRWNNRGPSDSGPCISGPLKVIRPIQPPEEATILCQLARRAAPLAGVRDALASGGSRQVRETGCVSDAALVRRSSALPLQRACNKAEPSRQPADGNIGLQLRCARQVLY
jgi:hypothetical protein